MTWRTMLLVLLKADVAGPIACEKASWKSGSVLTCTWQTSMPGSGGGELPHVGVAVGFRDLACTVNKLWIAASCGLNMGANFGPCELEPTPGMGGVGRLNPPPELGGAKL